MNEQKSDFEEQKESRRGIRHGKLKRQKSIRLSKKPPPSLKTVAKERRNQIISAELSGTSVWRPQSRYTVSRIECRITFPQNQRCRAKIALHPPPIKVSHLSPDPSVALSSLAAGRGPRGGVSRRAGGGYRGTFGFRKRIALQGGVAATVTLRPQRLKNFNLD